MVNVLVFVSLACRLLYRALSFLSSNPPNIIFNGETISDITPSRLSIHIPDVAQTESTTPGNKKKALLIGINYDKNKGGHYALSVPHRDVVELKTLLIDTYGYEKKDIVVMMDGGDDSLEPNQENILREIQILVKDAQPGDRFLFHYSGHAGQIANEDNTEEDGLDEVLIPSDDKNFDKIIMDDQLRKYLVDSLPIGCSLVAIIDCCHSGSMLDLEHHRCNRVYIPWIYNGTRTWTDMKRNGVVRRLAIVTSRGPSMHIYENKRVDHNTVKSKKTSLEFELGSKRVLIKSRSSSLQSEEIWFDAPQSRRVSLAASSSLMSEKYHDAPKSPIPDRPISWLPRIDSSGVYSPFRSGASSPIPMCASPVEAYCSGFCDPSPVPKPYVVSFSSCQDSQRSWEDDKGRSMTMAMIGFLRKNPRPPLDELMQYISHYLYDLSVTRHQVARKIKGKLKESKASADRVVLSQFNNEGHDHEEFQDPQLSSLDPLDMKAIFTL